MTSLINRARPEGVTDLSRTIGNSEVSAFLQCERKHYYAHLKKLEPRATSTPLSRGIIGHEALEVYYRMLMEGSSPNNAKESATAAVLKYLDEEFVDKSMLADLIMLLNRYWSYYKADEFMQILAVESAYEIPVDGEYNFGMRLDLLVMDKMSRIAIIDHKFVWDFYGDSVLEMNPQMPKYLGTLRFNGIKAEYAVLNQIRYRLKKGGNTDDELFKRATLTPNAAEVRQYMVEQFKVSERIMARRAMTPEAQSSEAVRTANQMVCKNCSFQPLCKSEVMGGDITLMAEVNYQSNAYVERQNPTFFEVES